MEALHFIAFDLGATSGRTILGTLGTAGLSLKELSRFSNKISRIGNHYYWNICSLYEHIVAGLKIAAKEGVKIHSIGIDTWGVDMVCIGKDAAVLGLPYSYRDPHTDCAVDDFFSKVMSRRELYDVTGIQIMNFNSLFQLYAMRRNKSSVLDAADKILFMPDALSFMLTGNMVMEYTIASTSQFLNPYTRQIAVELLEKVEVSPELFAGMVMPGETIGYLKKNIAKECGFDYEIPVIAVAGHDTASAVAAVPANHEKFAYLSSGTWSLMGIESNKPIINDLTFKYNITNEGGIDGTIRLLKNITGMWLLENCLKEWKEQGYTYSYPQIVEMAGVKPFFKSLIDPDHVSFANPESMTNAISEYCRMSSQSIPQSHGDFIACIFESLALKYRTVISILQDFAVGGLTSLHIIGGGSQNVLLNQYAANATGLEVIAGPAEATAIGNVMMQARAAGLCHSVNEMRTMICNGIKLTTFLPEDKEEWDVAYRRFRYLINIS